MRIVDWIELVDNGLASSPEFRRVRRDVVNAVDVVVWPPGNASFTINPTRKGNGVKPIKEAFIESLEAEGWIAEYKTFDAHLTFETETLPFAVEWETGNISSSHRAVNRLAKGMLEDRLSGGILVLPTAALYPYLTDRIGNVRELEPYFDLYRLWQRKPNFGYLGIVAVEHDAEDSTVPLIKKGTDGRALR